MLSSRQSQVLRIISREFITTGVPVSSDVIARNYSQKVSSATIRNDVMLLEQEGYILRPHTSAGAVPSDRGYRQFIETMDAPQELPAWEQHMVSHLFHQVERDTEEWVGLATSLLGRLTRCASLVTWPQAEESQFRHLGLVSLHRFLAMLVLVLQEARLRHQLLPLEEPMSQQALDATAARLNVAYSGLDAMGIEDMTGGLTYPLDEAVSRTVVTLMRRANQRETAQIRFHGWGYMLAQPEMVGTTARETVEALEERGLPVSLLPTEGLRVIIGEESREAALYPMSLVIASYGILPQVKGFIGVVGPTRMHYGRAISAVKFVSEQLNRLLSEIYS
ncbi:MAG: heat-inducible transcriptional repressor HrcA [Dehalococcoidia bacterium]|nr:heat-inducible transcriptional repressor HrcA [Dehalococcoidia bacterium]